LKKRKAEKSLPPVIEHHNLRDASVIHPPNKFTPAPPRQL